MTEELYTPEQLARRYGIGVSTIYGWKLRGIGPRWLKVGGLLRYRAADVEAWEDENSRTENGEQT